MDIIDQQMPQSVYADRDSSSAARANYDAWRTKLSASQPQPVSKDILFQAAGYQPQSTPEGVIYRKPAPPSQITKPFSKDALQKTIFGTPISKTIQPTSRFAAPYKRYEEKAKLYTTPEFWGKKREAEISKWQKAKPKTQLEFLKTSVGGTSKIIGTAALETGARFLTPIKTGKEILGGFLYMAREPKAALKETGKAAWRDPVGTATEWYLFGKAAKPITTPIGKGIKRVIKPKPKPYEFKVPVQTKPYTMQGEMMTSLYKPKRVGLKPSTSYKHEIKITKPFKPYLPGYGPKLKYTVTPKKVGVEFGSQYFYIEKIKPKPKPKGLETYGVEFLTEKQMRFGDPFTIKPYKKYEPPTPKVADKMKLDFMGEKILITRAPLKVSEKLVKPKVPEGFKEVKSATGQVVLQKLEKPKPVIDLDVMYKKHIQKLKQERIQKQKRLIKQKTIQKQKVVTLQEQILVQKPLSVTIQRPKVIAIQKPLVQVKVKTQQQYRLDQIYKSVAIQKQKTKDRFIPKIVRPREVPKRKPKDIIIPNIIRRPPTKQKRFKIGKEEKKKKRKIIEDKKKKKLLFDPKYVASLEAGFFGIKGKKAKGARTGIVMRPLA